LKGASREKWFKNPTQAKQLSGCVSRETLPIACQDEMFHVKHQYHLLLKEQNMMDDSQGEAASSSQAAVSPAAAETVAASPSAS
jgi:hypothetical protein